MALPNTQSLSMALLAMVTLIFTTNTQAHLNPLCKTTTDPSLCTLMIKGAKNPHEATANAISSSLVVAKRAKPVMDGIASHLPPGFSPVSRESLLSTCRDNYEDVIDNLTGALEDLKKGDKYGIITKLSVTCLSDCVDGFEQFNIPPRNVKKAQEELNRYTGISLVVSKLM